MLLPSGKEETKSMPSSTLQISQVLKLLVDFLLASFLQTVFVCFTLLRSDKIHNLVVAPQLK